MVATCRRVLVLLRAPLLALVLVLLRVDPGDGSAMLDLVHVGAKAFGHVGKVFKNVNIAKRMGKTGKAEYDASFSKPKPFMVYRPRLVRKGVVCGDLKREVTEMLSNENCGRAVLSQEGAYFIFGNGEGTEVDKCYAQFTHDDQCSEYGFRNNSNFDFYAMDQFRVHSQLNGLRKECKAKGKSIGTFSTVQKCAEAAEERGAKYFQFGTHIPFTGQCIMKFSRGPSCPEGFRTNLMDFYAFRFMKIKYAKQLESAESALLREDSTCASEDRYLGWFMTLERCANAVRDDGGKYFLWGKKTKKWLCYVESTSTADCEEGLQKDKNYDFYQVLDV
eukprot:TRINITY_DN46124_c0_g1_i1.p1 TRINITY_DN46124_c0_g1~~TRINITY_DN46124_c0_g1_i1.p1  ORF type:complete len:364 (-),score=91.84 TRINITY_DN46124_c0_g1_i1:119-1117(-)